MGTKKNLLQLFLALWLIGSFISFIMHFFFSTLVANLSLWNYSSGWQREIALWNAGIIFAIMYALVQKKVEILKFVTLILIVFSLFLGTNHFITLLSGSKITLIHMLGMIFNYAAVIFGVYIIK